MARARKLEEALAALSQLADLTTEAAIATLRQTLAGKYGVAIAQASRLIRKAEIYSLVPDLASTFGRCMVKPETTDPGCLAKTAIAEALYHLDYREEALFLQGIRHLQMEPVWGGKEDTAPALRSVCALGLVRMNYPQVLSELADLLADAKAEARIGAARAIAYTNNPEAAPLLRLRILVGDEPQVFSECLLALLKLTPVAALPLAIRFLDPPVDPLVPQRATEIVAMTALALGESRLPEAFDPLRRWWERSRDAERRQTALLAMAMLRHDEPLDFLLAIVAQGRPQDATDAIAALSLYQQDAVLWQRVCQTMAQRQNGGEPS
ncbi:hypothetical protein H6F76_27025 [Leptolyngbya sp. FACHB-321]|uniref:HEAT repeat domain-containing protein n=1 Tax=Leptolyngbya sp. FACHB-321 TaxID=2692807 RepID=UPI00168261B1|nr:HEAT repeat domain-containing protein [Leptolyngbya sp. FACHB-321]MBD2038611.1 hypothetical protein [Leptolyngbya sp. FACHB-321]